MNVLRLSNKKHFSRILKVFSGRSQVSFEISRVCMKVFSLEPPYIYASLPSSMYTIEHPTEFTINVRELERSLELLDSGLVFLSSSFRIVAFCGSECEALSSNSYSFVDVPLSNPIKPHYCLLRNFSTRLLMSKAAIRNLMRGHVQYQNGDGLLVRRISSDIEESMVVNVDYLSKGYLDFCCSNGWIDSVSPLHEMIHTALFGFGEGLLSIKLLLQDCKDAYVEIQVRELAR